MSKTLIGIVSYGGISFLELALRSIQETTDKVDVMVVIAKPGDSEMMDFLWKRKGTALHYAVQHDYNKGFPASVNDLLETAFVKGIYTVNDASQTYDNLIIMGNDVVALPGSIDAMIKTAEETDYEMVCGSEFNSRFLVDNYPEARPFFEGENLIFTDFSARPWELHKERRAGIEPHARKDIRNFTLFKRSAFEKVGYADAGFVPNGYFEDLDYCLRCDKLGVSACGLLDAPFFHFWSRTIHQNANRDHGRFYRNNAWLYHEKWGGGWQQEKYDLPYHGDPYELEPGLIIQPELKIRSREQEAAIIEHFMKATK